MALSQPSRRIILKRKIDKSSFCALPRKGQIPTSRKHPWSTVRVLDHGGGMPGHRVCKVMILPLQTICR